MNRLDVWQCALASAVTFAALTTVCAVAFIIAPDATVAAFNNLGLHGIVWVSFENFRGQAAWR